MQLCVQGVNYSIFDSGLFQFRFFLRAWFFRRPFPDPDMLIHERESINNNDNNNNNNSNNNNNNSNNNNNNSNNNNNNNNNNNINEVLAPFLTKL